VTDDPVDPVGDALPLGLPGGPGVSPEITVDVVTVTANPALDQTVWVPGFRAGEVNRVVREETSPGGKGVNVAAFLASFGLETTATGFLGRANAGLFEEFLEARGISNCFVPVAGVTRTGVKIVDDAGATTDVNFPGFAVTDHDLLALERIVTGLAAVSRWVVLAGSLPRDAPVGTYRRLVEAVHGAGGLVALDASGPALREAIPAGPDLVKPNRAELEELAGRTLPDRAALREAAEELARYGVGTAVVSLGAQGALFLRDGEAVFATPPPVRVASTVGAGDAMVAGTVLGTLRGLTLRGVAALATACSAVAISRVGPQLDPVEVDKTVEDITVEQEGSP
jgi:1-phosphofructokinase family hexose kinase